MGLFSWFKKKQIEAETPAITDLPLTPQEALKKAEEVGKALHKAILERNGGEVDNSPKLKFKAILSNSVLTVFMPNGNIYTNTGASKEMLKQVQEAFTENEIRLILLGPDQEEEPLKEELKREVETIKNDTEIALALPEIIGTGEFYEKEGGLYLNDIDVSIPKLLAREIIKAGKNDTSEYYDSLKRFWCWCVLNPDPQAREDLFGFLERGDFKITKNGFFLGYRNVIKKGNSDQKNTKLVEFITSKYLNIKIKQKKSPKNFIVRKLSSGDFEIQKSIYIPDLNGDEIIGNLADLYNGLSEMEDNEYTDSHTRTMKIKLGTAVKMPRGECNSDPKEGCSEGLHVKSRKFGSPYSFGDTAILVAVNPMNVVAVPFYENNKMRVCEYMPLGVLNKDDWDKFLDDADTLELEEEYADSELANLYKLASETSKNLKDDAKKLIGDTSVEIIKQVAKTLNDYKQAIDQRVVEVK